MELKEHSVIAHLSHESALNLDHDFVETARAVHLRYVKDSIPGIRRIKKGNGYAYYRDAERVVEKKELIRIKSLVIPPAWTNVWICPFSNGHIQATGFDQRNRKQYRYHTRWSEVRNETKFHRLLEFGKVLPKLRCAIEIDLRRKDLSAERVVATVISLMERTYIRVGSEDYEKLYGSYGITTLKDSHVKINGSELQFSFIGKKGKEQKITLRNKRLSRIVKQCRDIPGRELFQYYDAEGNRNTVDSGMVNDYIKTATGDAFTAKDIRTWAGSLNLLRSLCAVGEAISTTQCQRNVVQALNEVSNKLGNTRAVCKKYYVHPGLIRLYEENGLAEYLNALDKIEEPDLRTDLTSDEKILMRILKKLG
ncbi:MAG TPA: DNA topoisomerase IB [Ohtaekwangia sp.]|nr:DNA topoisomerase IB [Ohtaekwangia sp.]